jgi:hypothetical protein
MSYAYVPGTCNLGKAEIKRRQFVALIGLLLTITTGAGLLSSGAPSTSRWGLFVPAMVFSIGFIQSRKKFCLAYGFMGTFNLGKLGDLSRVQTAADRKADQRTALIILFQAALFSFLITILFVVLPI